MSRNLPNSAKHGTGCEQQRKGKFDAGEQYGPPPNLGRLASYAQVENRDGRVEGSDAVQVATAPCGGMIGARLLQWGARIGLGRATAAAEARVATNTMIRPSAKLPFIRWQSMLQSL